MSLFEQSQSDCAMVAAGFSPRDNGREKLRVAERRLNRRVNRAFKRRSATPGLCAASPRAKAHGYPHGLAPRSRTGSALSLRR